MGHERVRTWFCSDQICRVSLCLDLRSYRRYKVDVRVTSPQMSFDAYCAGEIPASDVIDLMVGDLQRIREYPKLGFQIAQPMDDKVWLAAQELILLGFNRHVLK